MIIKFSSAECKEKILKYAHKNELIDKRTPISLTVDLSEQTVEAIREWYDILQVLKGKICHPE